MSDEPYVISGKDKDDLLDALYREAFGGTRGDAQAEGVCANCGKPPTFSTEAGRREYAISGMCEPCFDRITAEPIEEDGG